MLVIIAIISAGCTSSSSDTPRITQPKPAPVVTNVNKDLSSIALTINDLPHGWLGSEKPVFNETHYSAKFVNIGGSVGVVLYFDIIRLDSVDLAKASFSAAKSDITDTRVDALSIGDEAFGFQRISLTSVVFRKANLIITISTETYPPYSIYQLQSFAKSLIIKFHHNFFIQISLIARIYSTDCL